MEKPSDLPKDLSAKEKTSRIFMSIEDNDLGRLLEMLPIPALVVDVNDTCVNANDACCAFFGVEKFNELEGTKFADLLVIDEPLRFEYIKLQMQNASESDGSWEFCHPEAGSIWGDVVWRDLPGEARLFIIHNSTKRKMDEKAFHDAERKRWQSQRIEALGRLAGGIAHDFNNFLAVILLHIDILNVQLPTESPIRDRVNEIKEVSNNVAGTVRQLLAFGRKQPMTLSPVVLNSVIKDHEARFRSLAGDSIEVQFSLGLDLGYCFVDQGQIAQVLTSLIRNAKDAMGAGGTLRIETSNIVVERNASNTVQPAGAYIQVLVADNGAGMDQITEDYIFEPFFSTKESDKGAGLALAMVYGTIKQCKGFIWVESELNMGSAFKIQFPRIDQAVREDSSIQTEEIPNGAGKTVLLVDDEEAVRRITAEFLKMSGYKVLEASSGMEALEIAQAKFEPIDLLLTDYLMPMMNGKEVADKITKVHPETSVLFMSGNIDNILPDDGKASDSINFIGKPFSSTSLMLKIREILDSKDLTI